MNGHYLSADSVFIEKRRRGLIRFLNELLRHPVLRNDDIVVAFISVPTELSLWRKTADVNMVEEFYMPRDALEQTTETSEQDVKDAIESFRYGLQVAIDDYIRLCAITERLTGRQKANAGESVKLAEILSSQTNGKTLYTHDLTPPGIIPTLNSVARHYDQASRILVDEAKGWEDGILEDLKRERDSLVSMKEMLDRWDRLGGDNIPGLEKRITSNAAKLDMARNSAVTKPSEIVKHEESIERDKTEIETLKRRRLFNSNIVVEEIEHFFTKMAVVPQVWSEHAVERVKYSEMLSENWRGLEVEIDAGR